MTTKHHTSQAARVLLLTLVFSPDGVSTAAIMSELAAQLRSLGHEIVVCTTTPHYNRDPDALSAQPLHPRWGRLLQESEFQGIPVYHAKVRAKGKRVLSRLLDYLIFQSVSTVAALRLAGRFQVVLAPSPPLTIGLSAAALSLVRRTPFVYNVQEIYPDIAVSLGILKSRPLIRILGWVERFIYDRADAVVVISDSFRNRLLGKGVPAAKLHVIPNFVDAEFIQPRERHNSFSREHGLDERFVVLYAGNVGLTQDFETIIGAARALGDLPEILFLIVGNGARRDWLATQIAEGGLQNVRLLPYQPHGVVPDLYASSDVGLVPLRQGTAQSTFPSKIYTVMAAGRPTIVAADPDSELACIVDQAQCGVAVLPGDPVKLAEAVRKAFLHREALRDMGQNGRQYVLQNHSPEAIARQYHQLIVTLTKRSEHNR